MLRLPLAAAGQQGPCPTCQREIVAPDPYRGIGGYEAPLPPPPVAAAAYQPFVESPPLVPPPRQIIEHQPSHEPEMVAARIVHPEPAPAYQIPVVPDLHPGFLPEPVVESPPAPEPFVPFSSPPEKVTPPPSTIPDKAPAPVDPAPPAAVTTTRPEPPSQEKAILLLSSALSGVIPLFIGFFLGICYDRLFHAQQVPSIVDQETPAKPTPTHHFSKSGKSEAPVTEEDRTNALAAPPATDEPAPSAPQPQPEPPPKAPEPPAKVSSAAEATLKAFLDAPDWASRATHVLFADEIRPAMEAYSHKVPDGPTPYQSLSVIQSQLEEKTGRMLLIFLVITDKAPNGIPVAVKETSSGWQVDWQTFIEFRDGLFEQFIAGPDGNTGVFHLRVSSPEKSRAAGTENEHFTSVMVNSLSDSAELAYVRKSSETADSIRKGMQAGSLYAVLEVTKKKTLAGQTYLEILSMKSSDWFPREN